MEGRMPMKIRQFVMAYSAAEKEIKRILPEGYTLLRPVLRINVEQMDAYARIAFNTPVECNGIRGWLNLMTWKNAEKMPDGNHRGEMADIAVWQFEPEDEGNTFRIDAAIEEDEMKENILTMVYEMTGMEGGCPAENDNQGTFYLEDNAFADVELITGTKEHAGCEFFWNVPVREIKVSHISDDINMRIRNAMRVEPIEVLGAYVVEFER